MPSTTVDLTAIAEAGVVGAGGAGFPTHVKLAGKADTVLINAAECEPLLHKDKEVLHAYGPVRCCSRNTFDPGPTGPAKPCEPCCRLIDQFQ